MCAYAEQKLSRQMEKEREVCAHAGKVRSRAAVPVILGD